VSVDDEAITEEERREAAALAAALDEGTWPDEGPRPDDALEAAALLRHGRAEPLDPARSQRALRRALAAHRRPRWRRVIVAATGALAVAATVLLALRPPGPTPLPPPPRPLLRAEEGPAREAARAAYRGRVYDALRARYGETEG
jgi:ferric-dicitrate binding protein FerR (iron transport regulator)